MTTKSTKKPAGIVGVFSHVDCCTDAILALKDKGMRRFRVYYPTAEHVIEEAIGKPTSPVGIATLIGALTGLISGFSLARFTSLKWGLIVWGKPLEGWYPWLIVGFEFTILFGCLSNFLAMLALTGLFRYKPPPGYDERFSIDQYGIYVPCGTEDENAFRELLTEKGAVEVHHA